MLFYPTVKNILATTELVSALFFNLCILTLFVLTLFFMLIPKLKANTVVTEKPCGLLRKNNENWLFLQGLHSATKKILFRLNV